jgi:TetR/AcrR family transcriptional repressor of mexJK operon
MSITMDFRPPAAEGTASTPPAEASPKRRQVLEAATDLFIGSGYTAVSMDAVARRAGVSKATLYAYFPSKQELFATIVGDACRRNTVVDANFPDEFDDIAAVLRQIGRPALAFLVQERTLAIFRVAVTESARVPELGAAVIQNGPMAFHRRFAAWAAAQTRAGHLDAGDGEVAADHFLALLRSHLFLRAVLGQIPTEAEIAENVERAVQTFLRAFGRPA